MKAAVGAQAKESAGPRGLREAERLGRSSGKQQKCVEHVGGGKTLEGWKSSQRNKTWVTVTRRKRPKQPPGPVAQCSQLCQRRPFASMASVPPRHPFPGSPQMEAPAAAHAAGTAPAPLRERPHLEPRVPGTRALGRISRSDAVMRKHLTDSRRAGTGLLPRIRKPIE